MMIWGRLSLSWQRQSHVETDLRLSKLRLDYATDIYLYRPYVWHCARHFPKLPPDLYIQSLMQLLWGAHVSPSTRQLLFETLYHFPSLTDLFIDYHTFSKLRNKFVVSTVLWKERWFQNGEAVGSRRRTRGEDKKWCWNWERKTTEFKGKRNAVDH